MGRYKHEEYKRLDKKLRFARLVINFVKFLSLALFDRARIKTISLHFGANTIDNDLDSYIRDIVIEVSPNVIFSVSDPVIEGFVHRHTFSDRAIYRLRDATFDTDTGNVYLGKMLVRESNSFTSNQVMRNSAQLVDHEELSIIGIPFHSHYHWLIETLPRIISASLYEPSATLIAPNRTKPEQREALLELGRNVIFSDVRHRSQNLVLPTRGEDTGWAHPHDLDVLRSTFCVPSAGGFRPIYITRVGSRRSDDLSRIIQDYAENMGWTIVKSEKLTWRDALNVFGEASVIASEHGAGLANIALAPLGTKLIELQRDNYLNPCYSALSQALNGNTSCYSVFPIDQYETALAASNF